MHVFVCYALSSPQINNGLFRVDWKERKERKRNMLYDREKKKVNKTRKKVRGEALMLCIRYLMSASMERRKKRKKKRIQDRERKKLWK